MANVDPATAEAQAAWAREGLEEIPVLDLGDYLAGKPGALEKLAADLRHAQENIGFYYLRNHGVPQELIDAAFAEVARFHAQPLDEKLKIRIGADLDALRKKFASTATWASGEQSGVASADEETLRALQQGNIDYEARYGFIFIVCATGKSAGEMLAILQSRLNNDPETELRIAAAEQAKITRIRLEKL